MKRIEIRPKNKNISDRETILDPYFKAEEYHTYFAVLLAKRAKETNFVGRPAE
jgi:hypothetical protein